MERCNVFDRKMIFPANGTFYKYLIMIYHRYQNSNLHNIAIVVPFNILQGNACFHSFIITSQNEEIIISETKDNVNDKLIIITKTDMYEMIKYGSYYYVYYLLIIKYWNIEV